MKKLCYSCFREMSDPDTVCPVCGYDPTNDVGRFPMALPHGIILAGKYITGRVLGQGGFGITYAAQDYKSKQLVAIKEYLPDTMASRNANHTVTAHTGAAGENFNYGKDCFLEEAKTLAEFIGNENIVRVLSYFEEYGTAYFAMEYIEGESLQDYIKAHGGKISWEDAMKFLLPVMDALGAVHSRGIVHRDVTPDNIYITKEGVVKLLDFGAARYSLGDKSRSLDVVLKHGFAPKEQYTRHGKQGPYTDVYTVGASFYFALTGSKPPDAIDRIEEDNLISPTSIGAAIPAAAEDTILKALSIRPQDRFQTMSDFKASLTGVASADLSNTGTVKEMVFDQTPRPEAKNDTVNTVLINDHTTDGAAGNTPNDSGYRKIYIIAGSIVGIIVILLIVIIILLVNNKNKSNSLPDSSAVNGGLVTGGNALSKAEQGVIIDNSGGQNVIVDDPEEDIDGNDDPVEASEEDFEEAPDEDDDVGEEDKINEWGHIGAWDLYATDWIFYYEDSYELTEEDVHYLEQYYKYEYWPDNATNGAARDTIQMLINEIYAYHGYHFNDVNLQDYFNGKTWYADRGNSLDEAKAEMNTVERKNMDLLEKMRNN